MIPLGMLGSSRLAAGGWAPDGVANLAGWFAADAITGLANGDPIATWVDAASVANMAQATPAARPTYVTAARNGRPVARFTTAQFIDSTARVTSSVTMALAVKVSGSGTRVLGWNGSGVAGVGPILLSGNRGAYLKNVGIPTDGAYTSGTWERWIMVTGKSGRSELWVNGSRVLDAASTQTSSIGVCRLGGSDGAPDFNSGGMDLGEFAIYTAALSDANIGSLDAYLATKWG